MGAVAKTRTKPASTGDVDALRARLAELEARLAAVETGLSAATVTHRDRGEDDDGDAVTQGSRTSSDGSPGAIPFTPADLRDRLGKPGGVLLTGAARLPRGVRASWQREMSTGDLLDADWTPSAESFAALAHPVRLQLLREVLRGARTVSALASLPGSGTTGQLYHHLKPLIAEGWLATTGRGRYEVPEDRVVPLMAIMTAARTGRARPAPAPDPDDPR